MISQDENEAADGGLPAVSGSPSPDDFPSLRSYWNHMDQFDKDHRTDTEKMHLDAMFQQYDALRKLGWSEACYCPKDGSRFLVIEAGSTGVFECHYQGEWPKGTYWTHSAGDLWPSRPILFKPLPENVQSPHAGEKGQDHE